jgi:hypothetical protein
VARATYILVNSQVSEHQRTSRSPVPGLRGSTSELSETPVLWGRAEQPAEHPIRSLASAGLRKRGTAGCMSLQKWVLVVSVLVLDNWSPDKVLGEGRRRRLWLLQETNRQAA